MQVAFDSTLDEIVDVNMRLVEQTKAYHRQRRQTTWSFALMIWQLLKDDRAADRIIADVFAENEEGLSGIRCPRCGWRPSPSCLWCCEWVDTPEPYFEACGTVWNTFSTGGRCPGCHHQWQWTSCFRCDEWSLHDDWYESTDGQR